MVTPSRLSFLAIKNLKKKKKKKKKFKIKGIKIFHTVGSKSMKLSMKGTAAIVHLPGNWLHLTHDSVKKGCWSACSAVSLVWGQGSSKPCNRSNASSGSTILPVGDMPLSIGADFRRGVVLIPRSLRHMARRSRLGMMGALRRCLPGKREKSMIKFFPYFDPLQLLCRSINAQKVMYSRLSLLRHCWGKRNSIIICTGYTAGLGTLLLFIIYIYIVVSTCHHNPDITICCLLR